MCFFSNIHDTRFGFYFRVFSLTEIVQDLLSFLKPETHVKITMSMKLLQFVLVFEERWSIFY